MGLWPAKTLLSAVELGVFTKLGAGPTTGAELGKSLGLAPRGWYDFFDTLVALDDTSPTPRSPTSATALVQHSRLVRTPGVCRTRPDRAELASTRRGADR
jgi:hypothetical protein